jgi:hypothetical protein
MKNLLTICLLAAISFTTFAKDPLRGSGVIVSRSFDFKDFDKVNIFDFDGKVDIQIGKTFSIKVDIDDNLEPMLRVEKNNKENELTVYLDKNKNGRLYLEDTHIKIKITMPESSVIRHRGNTDVTIEGIVGRYFRLENEGNGDVVLEGSVDGLDIEKSGNGDVKAKKLIAKTAKVKNYGNGNVLINSQISLHASGAGNGDVLQFGPGKIEQPSGILGNGEVKKI